MNEQEELLAPIHPGEVLLEEFLKPMGISQYRLANDISERFGCRYIPPSGA